MSRDASALSHSVSLDLSLSEEATLLPSNLRDTTQLTQMTHELRFNSKSDRPLRWIAGAFYSDIKRDYAQRIPHRGYDNFVDDKMGEGTSASKRNGFQMKTHPMYRISPIIFNKSPCLVRRLMLSQIALICHWGGAGIAGRRSGLSPMGAFFAPGINQFDKTKADGLTPRIIASYDLTDDMTVNAQASQGFRLGGVNDPLNVELCRTSDIDVFSGFQSYGDETLWKLRNWCQIVI